MIGGNAFDMPKKYFLPGRSSSAAMSFQFFASTSVIISDNDLGNDLYSFI